MVRQIAFNVGPLGFQIQGLPQVLDRLPGSFVRFAGEASQLARVIELRVELSDENRSPFNKMLITCDGEVLETTSYSSRIICNLHRGTASVTLYNGESLFQASRLLASFFLPSVGCIAVHAAAIVKNQKALVFSGPSGAGKSTLASIANENGLHVLSDDTMVLGTLDNQPYCWGTGFCSSANLSSEHRAVVAGLYYIEHGTTNRVSCLSELDTARQLMRNTMVRLDNMSSTYARQITSQLLSVVAFTSSNVPGYRFAFQPTANCLETVF